MLQGRDRGAHGILRGGEGGYAMAALLVGIAVAGVLMSAAMPAWRHAIQREREEELVFRGEQYARAIGLYQRKLAGGFPPSVDVLVEQKFLRRKYKDPMTKDGEFQVLYQAMANQPGRVATPGTSAPQTGSGGLPTGTAPRPPDDAPGGRGGILGGGIGGTPAITGPRGGVMGVASKSTAKSIRQYKGRSRYNEWQFVYAAPATTSAPQPGQPTGPGQRGRRPGQGIGPARPGPGGPGGARPLMPARPPGPGGSNQ